jgi:hypothetical protein
MAPYFIYDQKKQRFASQLLRMFFLQMIKHIMAMVFPIQKKITTTFIPFSCKCIFLDLIYTLLRNHFFFSPFFLVIFNEMSQLAQNCIFNLKNTNNQLKKSLNHQFLNLNSIKCFNQSIYVLIKKKNDDLLDLFNN